MDVESAPSALQDSEVRHKQGFPIRLLNPGTVPTHDVRYLRKYTWTDHVPLVWLPEKRVADPTHDLRKWMRAVVIGDATPPTHLEPGTEITIDAQAVWVNSIGSIGPWRGSPNTRRVLVSSRSPQCSTAMTQTDGIAAGDRPTPPTSGLIAGGTRLR